MIFYVGLLSDFLRFCVFLQSDKGIGTVHKLFCPTLRCPIPITSLILAPFCNCFPCSPESTKNYQKNPCSLSDRSDSAYPDPQQISRVTQISEPKENLTFKILHFQGLNKKIPGLDASQSISGETRNQ